MLSPALLLRFHLCAAKDLLHQPGLKVQESRKNCLFKLQERQGDVG